MDKNVKMVKGYVIWAIIFQLLFIAALCFFRNYPMIPHSFFHATTYEEANWYIQQKEMPYEDLALLFYGSILKPIGYVVGIVGISQLLFAKSHKMYITLKWKIVVPLLGFVAYCPAFYFFKYKVDHYTLVMNLVLAEALTLVLLVLALIRLMHSRAGSRT